MIIAEQNNQKSNFVQPEAFILHLKTNKSMKFRLLSPRNGEPGSAVRRPACHLLSDGREDQPAHHLHRNHGVPAYDAAAAGPLQPAAARPAPGPASAQSAASGTTSAAASTESSSGSVSSAQHCEKWQSRQNNPDCVSLYCKKHNEENRVVCWKYCRDLVCPAEGISPIK